MSESEKSPDSLTVYRGETSTNAFVWSPFVTKLEARLRFDSIPYKVGGGSPRSAPRGKIPYIEVQDAQATEQMGDSTFIIRRFIESGTATDLNHKLYPAQRAHDAAIRALMEDKMYFYTLREKWWDNYLSMRHYALGFMPWPFEVLVGLIAYRNISATLYGQGTGRFTHDEVSTLKLEVWENVSALLTDVRKKRGPFWVLGGKEPTEADATLFGFIASALVCDGAPATRKIVMGFPVLVEYAERIWEKYFPEYKKWEVEEAS